MVSFGCLAVSSDSSTALGEIGVPHYRTPLSSPVCAHDLMDRKLSHCKVG